MALSAQEKKQRVAGAALDYLREGMLLGVGTGSTVNALIDQLGPWKSRLRGAVSSSEGSTARLRAIGIPVFPAANSSRAAAAPSPGKRSLPPPRALLSALSTTANWSTYWVTFRCPWK